MFDNYKRCIGCMNEIGNATLCPSCGYIKSSPVSPQYLQPGAIINERYLIGKLLSYNGERAVYIAFDTSIESVVEVAEYFPGTLCEKERNGSHVIIANGAQPKYKALMSDFVELANQLKSLRTLKSIAQTYEITAANGTVYAIGERVSGITLSEYLADNMGEIEWNTAQTLFMPFVSTLGTIHAGGIIHRGISPETIIVTPKHELKLTGFSIASARTVGTELSPQIFAGYAAPEQYTRIEAHGPWTDIYSLAAVMYKSLTGTMPPESSGRSFNDNLVSPRALNSNIPVTVSSAIMNAMSYSTEKRYQTSEQFKEPLSKIVPPEIKPRPININADIPPKPEEKKKSYALTAMAVTFLAFLLIAGTVLLALWFSSNRPPSQPSSIPSSDSASESGSSASTRPSGTHEVPNFVGRIAEVVRSSPDYVGVFEFSFSSEYNEQYARGVIFEQSVDAREIVSRGEKIEFKVSRGSRYPTIPEFTIRGEGKLIRTYENELRDLSIKYDITYEETDEHDPDTVIRVHPSPGTTIDISGAEILRVYVAKEPTPSSVTLQ
ncbi:MAG: PASTA domain-containing protein [Oscillospiraceae bacterium]|nr:PASTA domain-containing protein [Oscillospiraceae bacterium]